MDNYSVLNFYKQPFHRSKYGSWVYDANNNFVFQFEHEFDKNGMLPDDSNKLEKLILESLNSDKHEPLKQLNLTIDSTDPTVILNNNEKIITIRGWGNLTGFHKFPYEKAAKIQDDFIKWIFKKLTTT